MTTQNEDYLKFLEFLEKLRVTTKSVIDILVTLPEYPDANRNKGFLYVRKINGETYFHEAIGDVESAPQDKQEKYKAFSKEKSERLSAFIRTGSISSFQSRNPEADKWGGAIRCDEVILSFSGLPELGDEALCLVVALMLNLMSRKDADDIAAESSNPFFEPLLKAAA